MWPANTRIVVRQATNVVSVDVGALCTCLILIWSKCISVEEAYSSVDGRVMVAIVCAFGVSNAMDNVSARDDVGGWVFACCSCCHCYGPQFTLLERVVSLLRR